MHEGIWGLHITCSPVLSCIMRHLQLKIKRAVCAMALGLKLSQLPVTNFIKYRSYMDGRDLGLLYESCRVGRNVVQTRIPNCTEDITALRPPRIERDCQGAAAGSAGTGPGIARAGPRIPRRQRERGRSAAGSPVRGVCAPSSYRVSKFAQCVCVLAPLHRKVCLSTC